MVGKIIICETTWENELFLHIQDWISPVGKDQVAKNFFSSAHRGTE